MIMLAFVDQESRVPPDHRQRTIKALADQALERLSPEFYRMYADVGRLSIPPERFPIPRNRAEDEIGFGIPITYVPLRNTIFISMAAALLESQVLHAIEIGGASPENTEARVYMAPNAIDYSGYPDCRPEFFEKMKHTLEYGSKLWTQYQVRIAIETPIIELSKAEIAELGVRLKAPLDDTWSCYEGGELPCGACDSCILRAKGFEEAGIADPLLVRLGRA